MTEWLTVYGFGSFFNGDAQPRDIDLLLLHRSMDFASSKFAIDCKAQIKLELACADIVMLSQVEADSQNFLLKSKAIELSKISADTMFVDVRLLVDRIANLQLN